MGHKIILQDATVILAYIDTMKDTGQGSAQKCAEYLGTMGYLNPITHKAITKQAVLLILRKSSEGRELLKQTSKGKWRNRYQ